MVRIKTPYAILSVVTITVIMVITMDPSPMLLIGLALLSIGLLWAWRTVLRRRNAVDSFDEYMRKIGDPSDRWR